jgi:hypothetical protein
MQTPRKEPPKINFMKAAPMSQSLNFINIEKSPPKLEVFRKVLPKLIT